MKKLIILGIIAGVIATLLSGYTKTEYVEVENVIEEQTVEKIYCKDYDYYRVKFWVCE